MLCCDLACLLALLPLPDGNGVQASVNPKAETVEELQGRRKTLHMGMLKLAVDDLSLKLQAGIDSAMVPFPPANPAEAKLHRFAKDHISIPYLHSSLGSMGNPKRSPSVLCPSVPKTFLC